MNKRRQTRSPRLLYLALAAIVLGLTAPPLPAQGTGNRVIELRGTETLGIGTSPSKAATAKVGQDLLALYAEYQAHLKHTSGQGAAAPAFKSSNAIAPVAGGSVVIDATASGDAEALAADLHALGAENVTVFGRMVSSRLPITAIRALQDLSSLQFARPAYGTTNVEDAGATGGPAERPAAKGVRPAMQIYIDPETGELLDQPPEGVNTIPAKPASTTVEEIEQVKSSVPGGGIKADVKGHFQIPIEDRIGADRPPVLRRGATLPEPAK